MKKFNKLFTTETRVKIAGVDGWHKVKSVHQTRCWIEVIGLDGSFQRGHVESFTNKKES